MWRRRDAGQTAEEQLQALLQRTVVRVRLKDALVGAAGIAVVVTLVWLTGMASFAWPWVAVGLSALIIAAVFAARRVVRAAWSVEAAARAMERACPDSRNVIVTAAELSGHPDRARDWIRARVFDDALRMVSARDVRHFVPLRGAAMVCVSVIGVCALAAIYIPRYIVGPRPDASSGQQADEPSGAKRAFLHATITPPAYIGGARQLVVDPRRLEALQGSRVRLTLRPNDAAWRVRFGAQTLPLVADRDAVHVDMILNESGYFAIENSLTADRRLLPVLVTPDRSPVVRMKAPGKDLLVPDVTPSIRVSAAANDDHGLTLLEIRYTKVSGSGEQFEFEEGTLPLEMDRRSSREWTARGVLSLGRLSLEPGDALVYRAVGRDARPGDAGLASSDTFIVEVAGPGQVAIAGFELPPDRERYALSQQMIVLKIERLRAREKTLVPPALADETGEIAAEQRAVRSNFIFLLGGHVEDEVEEAEHEHEIQEGRLENTARREINQAIHHMSRAEQALVAGGTLNALTEARAAVQALQRAFGRNRYILRTLPVRSRLDPSRRLAGELHAAADWQRDRPDADLDQRVRAARATLADVLAIAPALRSRAEGSREVLTSLAEEALRVAPGDEAWQRIAAALLQLRERPAAQQSEATESALGELLSLVIAESKRGAILPAPGSPEDPALRSVWAEERRRR